VEPRQYYACTLCAATTDALLTPLLKGWTGLMNGDEVFCPEHSLIEVFRDAQGILTIRHIDRATAPTVLHTVVPSHEEDGKAYRL
jgi:hypothetical protein